MTRKEWLEQLELEAALFVMGWHTEQVGVAYFWADDDGIPQVARREWHPFSNSEQAAMVVEAAEKET
jgi:hypothetical protein